MKSVVVFLAASLVAFSCHKKKDEGDSAPATNPVAAQPVPEEPKGDDVKSEPVVQAVVAAIVAPDPTPSPTDGPQLPSTPDPTPLQPPVEKLDFIAKLIFSYFDLNKSGSIDLEEFLKGLRRHFLILGHDRKLSDRYEVIFKRNFKKLIEIFLKYAGDDKEMSFDELKQLLKDRPHLLELLFKREIKIPVIYIDPDSAVPVEVIPSEDSPAK